MASLGFSEPEQSSFSVSKYFHMVFGPTFWTCLGQALDISWVFDSHSWIAIEAKSYSVAWARL